VTITEANDINTVLYWAMGQMRPYDEHPSDAEATEAARRLAARANKTLMAGLRPDEVALDRAECSTAIRRVLIDIEIDTRAHGGTP
jgi:hypothetical protein